MARPVVVTLLGSLACTGSQKPPPGNPPPPPVQPQPKPVTTAPPGEHDRTQFTKVLNAEHAEHGRIYRSADATCYVHLPFAEPPKSVRPPPRETVDCPESMQHESWSTCAGGTVNTNEAGDACLCTVMGNPPPPPRPIDCPES